MLTLCTALPLLLQVARYMSQLFKNRLAKVQGRH
jgi:hypothetical protein